MSDPSHVLRACLDAYAGDPQSVARKLRYLIDQDPQAFDQVALTLISGATDSPAVRYTIALLASRGRLAPLIRRIAAQDPGSAGMLAHIAQKVDAHIDLTRPPIDGAEAAEIHSIQACAPLLHPLSEALRGGLELLAGLAAGNKMNGNSRSRLARVAGRCLTLHSRLLEFLEDADPRVRANAVESLWNMPGSLSVELLRRAAQDPHHRVAANALIGLHLAGEISSLGSLIGMTSSTNQLFQAAAVWAMGRTGDERFEAVLKQIRAEGRPTASLLRNVLPAMARIRQSRQVRESRNIGIRILATEAGPEWARYTIAVHAGRGPVEDRLRPIEFHPYCRETPIWDYHVASVGQQRPIHVSWLLPATTVERNRRETLNAGILRAALDVKRPLDCWSVNGYRESRPSHFASDYGDIAQTRHGLAGGLRRPVAQTGAASLLACAAGLDPQGLPLSVCASAAAAAQPVGTEAAPVHLILVADLLRPDAFDPDDVRALAALLRERAVAFHVLASSRVDEVLVETLTGLAGPTGGWVLRGDVESSPAQAALIAAAIHRHWRLTLPMHVNQDSLSLRIVSGNWRGETALPAPELPVPVVSAA